MFSMRKRLIEQTPCLPAGLLKPTAPATGTLPGGIQYAFGYDRRFLRVNYCVDGEAIEEDVDLAEADCYYGGSRRYYVCYFCERRCCALYLPPGFTIFACRSCRNLTYATQKMQPLARRVRCLQLAQGRCPAVRPRYMHWKTWQNRHYERLKADQDLLVAVAKRAIAGSESQ